LRGSRGKNGENETYSTNTQHHKQKAVSAILNKDGSFAETEHGILARLVFPEGAGCVVPVVAVLGDGELQVGRKGYFLVMPSLALIALLATTSPVPQIERGQPLPRKPSFGAQMVPLTAEEATKAGVTAGVKIVRILPGTSAEALKLAAGDILVGVDGTVINVPAAVSASLRGRGTGDVMTWKILRDGKPMDLRGPLVGLPMQKEAGLTVVYDQVLSLGKRIRVMATHPEGKGPFPTIFLIGGIGA